MKNINKLADDLDRDDREKNRDVAVPFTQKNIFHMTRKLHQTISQERCKLFFNNNATILSCKCHYKVRNISDHTSSHLKKTGDLETLHLGGSVPID